MGDYHALVTWCPEHGYITAHDGYDETRGYCPYGDHNVAAVEVVPTAQLREAVEALHEAIDLLDSARSDYGDPGLKRRWAHRRKALRSKWGRQG